MKKARDLRDWLLKKVTAIKKNPERLIVIVDKGAIVCRPGSLSYEYRYDLAITFTDYADHADTLIVPLLAWIAANQPDLLRADDTLHFEAEIVDHERTDVRVTLPLTERVIVRENRGRAVCTHCDEPPPDDLSGPAPWQLFINGTPADEIGVLIA